MHILVFEGDGHVEWFEGNFQNNEAELMADWDSRQFLKFESDRTRPPRDLLAQVPLQRARKIVTTRRTRCGGSAPTASFRTG